MSPSAALPNQLGAGQAAAAIAAGELTSEQLVSACLERIAAREPDVRAWAQLDPGFALKQARARDAVNPAGPLHGVPVAIKDIIDTADLPTEMGTPIHAGRRPESNAECVRRLLAAGAVILGKTVTTEFATWSPAQTRNPHDLAHTPGGSSSGSAAAVADDMAPLALGTQTVGSTIRPASFCGIAAIKPTFGLLDLRGVNQTSPLLDTLGIFARDPADLGLVVEAIAGTTLDLTASSPRVALVRSPWWNLADPDSRRAVELAAAALAATELELPAGFTDVVPTHETIAMVDVAHCLAPAYEAHRELLSNKLREMMELGMRVDVERYRAEVAAAERHRRSLDPIFRQADVLVMAAATGEAPRGLDWTGDPIFCRPWSMLGHPVVTVPVSTGVHGLPVGVQLVAAHGGESAALAAAARLRQALS